MVQGEVYPQYLSGCGYVIPAGKCGFCNRKRVVFNFQTLGALKCMYNAALETPYMHINDVWISGYVRSKCGFGLRQIFQIELKEVKFNHGFEVLI